MITSYKGDIGQYTVSIDISDRKGIMSIFENSFQIFLVKESLYENLKTLSADLRDNLGLAFAVKFLEDQHVPTDSVLWDLNRHGDR